MGATALLATATLAAVLVARVLLAPARGDLIELATYLALSGIGTILLSAGVTRLLERYGRLTLAARFVLVTIVGSMLLVANVVVLARLMFISTGHDLRVLISAAVFSAIVAVGFALWCAYAPLARVTAINRAIRGLARGSMYEVSGLSGEDELALLARDVNVLGRRLAEAEAERRALDGERRELTASVSHDLRTPLSTIRAMVDAMSEGVVQGAADTKRYLAAIRRDVDRLSRMIDDLFELAQIDGGALRLRPRRVAIVDLVAEAIEAAQARADRARVALSLHVEDDMAPAMLDADRVDRAVSNLLQNALEHTPAGGAIRVSLRRLDGDAIIDVADTGEGIAEADISRVWTRFFRGDRSRSRPDGTRDGVGLGLAITRAVVELHGGTVAVRSTPGCGATFTLRLPLRPDAGVDDDAASDPAGARDASAEADIVRA